MLYCDIIINSWDFCLNKQGFWNRNRIIYFNFECFRRCFIPSKVLIFRIIWCLMALRGSVFGEMRALEQNSNVVYSWCWGLLGWRRTFAVWNWILRWFFCIVFEGFGLSWMLVYPFELNGLDFLWGFLGWTFIE